MISLEELKEIGKIKGLNLGQAEKDYLLDLVLSIISSSTKDELVFKGGTCLNKFYKLDRFSEDLDFSQKKEINIDKLIEKIQHDIKLFGMECQSVKKKEPFNCVLTTLKIKGPLYAESQQTICPIRIDINMKSEVELQPSVQNYNSLYREIPSFTALVMDIKEILAEKIRAVMARDKARDVYDLWSLVTSGHPVDMDLVKKKLAYYQMEFGKARFSKSLEEKRDSWENDLKALVRALPAFEVAKKDILNSVRL